MKNNILLFSILLAAIVAKSQNWVEFTSSQSTKPICNVLTSNDTLVKFNVTIPGMFETAVDTFNRVNIKEHTKMDSVGYPEIPIVSFLVAIPECDSVQFEIELIDSTQFSNFNIYPAPELVPDTTAGGAIALVEQFAYNRTAYETDAWFPGNVAETVDKGAIRAQNVVRVVLYPVQFNPVKKTINTYSEIQVSLSFYNTSGSVNNDVGIFNEVVGNTLINYESNGLNASVSCGAGLENSGSWYFVEDVTSQKIDSACDYLLITHDSLYFTETGQAAVDSLAAHRANFNGFDVAIITTTIIDDDIIPIGLDLKEKIFTLIENTYNSINANHTYDGKLAYVNLFSDVELEIGLQGIPTHEDGYDVYFTQLTWDSINGQVVYDIYPDLMIGRCSVDTVTQVENVVHKIINFKPEELDYKHNMLTIAGGNISYKIQSDVLIAMDDILPDYYNKKLIIDPGFNYPYPNWVLLPYTTAAIQDSWATGKMFVNYMDHGSSISWGNPYFNYDHIDSSLYDNVLPFVLSAACKTGAFQNYDDCMAEQFLCEDSIRGVIAFFGSSILTGSATFYFINLFYNSLIRNYSSVMGEAIMESKLKINNYSSVNGLKDYNLFGDPALNILYENADTIYPDLVAKTDEIIITPEYPSVSENLNIETTIRNITLKDASEQFYVTSIAVKIPENDTLWIGDTLLPGLNGYSQAILNFNIGPYILEPSTYKILVQIDTSNNITEMNENNNVSSIEKRVFSYVTNLHIVNDYYDNSHPVSFNLNSSYPGDEIVFGDKIITANGALISDIDIKTTGYTSVGNLTNDNHYQILQFGEDSVSSKIMCTGVPSWSNNLAGSYFDHKGPVVFDFDNDGNEEVLIMECDDSNFSSSLKCFNSNGTPRWTYYGGTNSFFITPVPIHHPSYNIIILDDFWGIIYFMKENLSSDSLILVDTIQLQEGEYYYFISDPVISDLNKDNIPEMIFISSGYIYGNKINLLDLEDNLITFKDMGMWGHFSKPIVTDLDNDGLGEIVTAEDNAGLLVFNYNLDTTIMFIEEPNIELSEIVSGDFDNDGNNDIVFQVKEEENKYYLNIYNGVGESIYNYPIIAPLDNVWISDINENGKNEIIYSYRKELFVITLPTAGSSIGWPGQQGNVRNTGVLEHPAYFAPYGDTVYWMNTISLSGDNILPAFSTVVIKPGTKIKAHTGGSLVVHGTLIVEGTENHPIVFSADINGADNDYWQGITVTNFSSASFAYCHVSDAEMGILVEDENDINISYCRFENNLVGIGAFNSSPVIYENFITNNNTGIHSWKNAAPVLTDFDKNNPFRNGIIDNQTGIKIYEANIYLKYGFNDIYNIPDYSYYIYRSNIGGGIKTINAVYNYWGTTNINQIYEHLYPPDNFIIEPICMEAQSPYTPPGGDESEMLKSAYNSMETGEYQIAENTFKDIINQYPATDEAYLSVSGLYENTNKSNGNWNLMETYLSGLYNDSTFSIDFQKLAFGYLNLCKRKQSKFTEAIANYESVILNDPTYNDSVYAVIDIGNTYEEAGNYKSSLGQLSYLVPLSRAKHVEKTVDLLLSLRKEKQKLLSEHGGFILEQNYPNPFNKTTTIGFYVPYSCKIYIEVVDILGREIVNMNEGTRTEGEHKVTLDLSNFSTGVYYYILKADNSVAGVRKMVVK